MYICFYSGLKLYLTGCLCLMPFSSQIVVGLHWEAPWFLTCEMAIKYQLSKKHRFTATVRYIQVPRLGFST